MSIRDFLCDENYLSSKLKFNEEQIDKKSEKVLSLQNDIKEGIQRFPKKNEDIIYDTNVRIFQMIYESIRIKYSLGLVCNEIEDLYFKGIDVVSNIGYKSIGYVNLIQFFSLGILLEVSKDKMDALVQKADEEELDDILFDFLVDSYNLNRNMISSGFQKENPYKAIAEIVELAKSNTEVASSKLVEYVEDKWIKGHADFGWADAHKRVGYVGLWSFESAAISKIFQLDDKELKENNHYPYELVRYKDGAGFKTSTLHKSEVSISKYDNSDGIEKNKELELIIPRKFHELINQVITDYSGLEDLEFYEKYNLNDVWFSLDIYKKEKADGLLGAVIVNVLVDKGYILQIDYKEDILEFIDDMENFWDCEDVILIRFELENDQKYYAKVPSTCELKKLYELNVVY